LMGISIWIIFVKQRKDLKKETFWKYLKYCAYAGDEGIWM
jgi:hypothetical protein